jgi:hypothetical protein
VKWRYEPARNDVPALITMSLRLAFCQKDNDDAAHLPHQRRLPRTATQVTLCGRNSRVGGATGWFRTRIKPTFSSRFGPAGLSTGLAGRGLARITASSTEGPAPPGPISFPSTTRAQGNRSSRFGDTAWSAGSGVICRWWSSSDRMSRVTTGHPDQRPRGAVRRAVEPMMGRRPPQALEHRA